MNKLLKKSLPAILAAIQLAAMLLFAFSFFNAEEALTRTDTDAKQHSNAYQWLAADSKLSAINTFCGRHLPQSTDRPLFKKMVFIVIDALRHEFLPSIDHKKSVHKRGMPFTESLLKTNGIGMISVSATPTVTMPRIKAMISGTLPSFMDYILNLSAYKFNGENLVENAHKARRRVVFFGDDTWIHLLPKDLFHKYNGTSSFFATDYTEVDTNVTYCVDRELKRLDDWDIMITHYLGVDHIGHSHGGFHSKLMPKKLMEMDAVVKSVVDAVSQQSEPYLIVITGDHGMTDVGNHGGSTAEETDTALVFLSSKDVRNSLPKRKSSQRAERVLQVDVAPTMASLLGLPVPNKSQGKTITSVLSALNMSKEEQLCHLFSNAIQISDLIKDLTPELKSTVQKAFQYHHILTKEKKSIDFDYNYHYKSAITFYDQFIGSIQMQLINKFSENSFFSLLTLSVVLAIVPIVGFLAVEYTNRHTIVFCRVRDIRTAFALATVGLNGLLLLSTSFIESQHYFWYYMTATLAFIYLVIAVHNFYRFEHPFITSLQDPFSSFKESYTLLRIVAIVMTLILLRTGSYWNLLYGKDIGQWLSASENKHALSALVICSLIAISYLMSTKRFGKQQCLLISGLVWVYLYRSDCGTVSSFKIPHFLYVERNIRAKIVFFHVYLIIIESFFNYVRKYFGPRIAFLDFLRIDNSAVDTKPVTSITLRTVCTIWVLLSALFVKVHNIPLLAINLAMEKLVNYAVNSRHDSYRVHLAITYLCFAESAFYSLGNSNTLSTIDVAPAFIGLDSYQPLLATLFMVISVYSLYVYWLLMLFIRLKDSKSMFAAHKLWSVVNLLLTIRFGTVLVDMFVTIVLRNHLFIWSVLCPKFLYEAVLTLVNELIVLFVICNNLID